MASARTYRPGLERFLDRWIGGHVSIGPLTIYGRNAMHFALNLKTSRWGYLCFHPTVRCFGVWWLWYFYASPNATPWASTFAIGPGLCPSERAGAILRRAYFGHGFNTDRHAEELRAINDRF